MVEFKVFSPKEVDESWDKWLADFKDHHFRQTRRWGVLKTGAWKPLWCGLLHSGTPVVMALCLVRRAPLGAATIAWINGGPVFRKDRAEGMDLSYLGKFLDELKKHFASSPRTVVRLNMGLPADVETQIVVRQAGFQRPIAPLDTGLTYVVDLGQDPEALRERMEKNWRHQLRSADKAKPEIVFGRDETLLKRYLALNEELVSRKGLADHRLSLDDLRAMAETLGESITFVIVSTGGRDGCGGALWTFADKGSFALSSANKWGLKHHLPNFMFWQAILRLKELGYRELDLAGIDPDRNWGVFNFKRGMRVRPVEMLGEWECSSSAWTRRLCNLALSRRRE